MASYHTLRRQAMNTDCPDCGTFFAVQPNEERDTIECVECGWVRDE